jgi:hypothetical protein
MTKLVQFIVPFKVVMQPMKSLLVATFKGDPEFASLEPQVFDDSICGKGMRCLRYRHDGRVDVYWQPGVRVDRQTFEIGAGVGDFVETTIEPARLEINERGVYCDVALTDCHGRRVALRVQEDVAVKRPFPLLAPVGADIQNPLMLLLVYMPHFDFVSRAGIVEGRIGERALHPDSIPLLLQTRRVWLTRYANHPITAGLINPPMREPVQVEIPAPGSLETDGMTLATDELGRLIHLSAGMPPQQVILVFSPGLVSLSQLPDGGVVLGRWSVSVAGAAITGGRYRLARVENRVEVELDVTEHWKPSNLPLGMNILTRLMRMFRTWPASYRWRGTVELGDSPKLLGVWQRKVNH